MKREMLFLLAGLILGVGLTLAVGAVSGRFETGRYMVSAWNDRVYVVDTATGELWERRTGGLTLQRGTVADPRHEFVNIKCISNPRQQP